MAVQVEHVERLHAGLLAGAVCAAYATGWLSAPSLLLGGAVMGANVRLMREIVRRVCVPAHTRPELVVVLLLMKFSLFLGLLGLLFWRVRLDALAFGVGATLLLVACVATALRPPRAAAAS